jgi:hypothetical protein
MADSHVRVQVRVGEHWVPAHIGTLTEREGRRLLRTYQVGRPSHFVRLVQVGSESDA